MLSAFGVEALSVMFCAEAKDRVTVAVRLARLPPLAVTSYRLSDPLTAVTAVTVAVVPDTEKSPASTFWTSSLNVTRHFRVSALVGELLGVLRSIEVTRGAMVSGVLLVTSWSVKLAAGLPAASRIRLLSEDGWL